MRIIKHIVYISSLTAALSSCDGAFSSIYDEPVADTAFAESFRQAGNNRFTLMLDATAYDEWVFLDLDAGLLHREKIPQSLTDPQAWNGRSGHAYQLLEGNRHTLISEVPTDAQPEPESWQLAFHHFDVRTNGAKVLETDYTSLNSLPASSEAFPDQGFSPDQWSDNVVMTDLRGMMGYKIGYQKSMVNRTLSSWVRMDITTPPPTYSADGHVYIVRFPDGKAAAIRLASYMSDRGSKGYLTIEGIYPY